MADSLHNETARRFRLLMTADAVGGVWQYAVDLISELTCRGFEVLLATMGPLPSNEQKQRVSEIGNARLVESNWALEWMPLPWSDVEGAGEWLLDLRDEFHPDLIHLNGYAHAALPWGRPVLTVAHSCVCSWWRAVHGESAGPEWNAYRDRVAAGLRASTAVASPSRSMALCLEREYGISHETVDVIHNFSRVTLLATRNQPFFLATGRFWDSGKNLCLLDGIARDLPWPVRVAGSGYPPAGHSVSFRDVTPLGVMPHPDLINEMSRAAIFVHPALYEPFGLAVLEAARAECCLVLSDIPSLRELWEGAAVFLDPNDRAVWARELTRLANDPERRMLLGRRAQERSMRYHPANSAAEYVRLYAQMIHSGRETAA